MPFGTVAQAVEDVRRGKFVVVADDEDRENEGDLICAAQLITPAMVNVMLRAKGMICVSLPAERIAQLELPMQGTVNTEAMKTAFTVSVDGGPEYGVTTGISASDRARTIQLLADPSKGAGDLRRPGHVHPLKAREGGVEVPGFDLEAVRTLTSPEEQDLIRRIASFPDMLAGAALAWEPHRVAFWLQETISAFHSWYTQGKRTGERVIGSDPLKTRGRLFMCRALKQTLANGLAVLGVGAPDRMESPETSDIADDA